MFSSALGLALMTTWTYAGFMAEPSPPPPPLPSPPVPSPSVPTPATVSLTVATATDLPGPRSATAPTNPINRAITGSGTTTEPNQPAEVIRYRMTDAAGQVWEHTDPAFLQAFVAERNSQMLSPSRRVFLRGKRFWR